MSSRNMAAPVVAVFIALAILGGCGGGGGGAGPVPPPPGPTFTVQGRVIAADYPTVGIGQAEINAAGVMGTTATDGTFRLERVPVGAVTVQVNPLRTPGYQPAAITIPATSEPVVTTTIALLPQGAAAPTSINLQPQATTVEVGTSVQFTASIVSASGVLSLATSWLCIGQAGTLSNTQLFTAVQPGTNQVYVFSGGVGASTTVSVIPEQGPVLQSVLVDPPQITASGGPVTFTVAASDGQGLASVKGTVYPPSGDMIPVTLALVTGTSQAGTYRATWNAPANSNLPDVNGVQAPQAYRVRFAATDNAGNVTQSNYLDFTVQGLAPPPPPPAS
ncbi:MAG: hypothetical protein GX100_03360 [candidate division WS1 bacterium]|nr:hypothetical protein [candidate division WS1 bacterium]